MIAEHLGFVLDNQHARRALLYSGKLINLQAANTSGDFDRFGAQHTRVEGVIHSAILY